VAVSSGVGSGSLFRLRFPNVAIAESLNEAEQAEASTPADFNELPPSKILVVDDNEMNRQLVGGMLGPSHHELEFGRDGRQAVAKAESFQPHLILMDVRMPHMDGWEALQQIRKLKGMESTPIIAVTACGLAEDQKRLRTTFNAYLQKPFSRHALFAALSQFLRPVSTGEREVAVSPAAVTELITHLRELEAKEWREVCDGMVMGDARSFAQKLERLARQNGPERLLAYAELLAHDATTYAVDALETHLQDFPALIARLERHGL
jgi:CheY-like chemotaxis protein